MKRALVVHPFLLAAFPIVFLYEHNLAEAPAGQVVLPLLLTLGLTALLFGLSRLLVGNARKAGLLVSLPLVLFFSYGRAVEAASHIGPSGATLAPVLPWLWFSLLTVGLWLIVKTGKPLDSLTNFLNVAGFAMLVISLFGIVSTTVTTNGIMRELGISAEIGRAAPTKQVATDSLPDIYYIILDSYPSQSNLKEVYSFDNTEFIDYLKNRGFYVADQSRSNYAMTYLSLASSLNMEHIDYLSDKLGPGSTGTAVPALLIRNNKAIAFLRSRGYEIVHFKSGWSGTDRNEFADVEIEYGPGDEFVNMLVETTALRSFQPQLGMVKTRARERILSIFGGLKKIPERQRPTFTFAHLVPPHPPYFFGANGEEVERPKLQMAGMVWTQKQKYLDQVVFVNNQMKSVIESILAKSEKPPIIIIQGDHGSASSFYTDKSGGWLRPTPRQLRERMRVLNAFYLPGGDYSILRPDITPVNSFRLVFNRFLDADFKPRKDISYYSNYMSPYVFTDVTKVVSGR